MSSPASIKGHPLHPVLVALPIGLWVFSLACDLLGLVYRENWLWQSVALYALVGGVIGAFAAAVPGLVDLLALRDPEVRRIGVTHMTINLVVIAIFIGDAVLRFSDAIGTTGPVVVSLLGVVLLGISGWLGGEMVYKRGVAVASSRRVRARLS